ncbi:hypothetical protein Trydic_g23348 [Trypoxylus dichotomus]
MGRDSNCTVVAHNHSTTGKKGRADNGCGAAGVWQQCRYLSFAAIPSSEMSVVFCCRVVFQDRPSESVRWDELVDVVVGG